LQRNMLPIPLDISPMEARLVDALPAGDGWQFEPKWDGFRCLAFRDADKVELHAKSGKSLARYFPEVVAACRELAAKQFVVDGELVIPTEGSLSFEALQMRLHPAESRIRKLASATPALLILFDCLTDANNRSLLQKTLNVRRKALEAFFAKLPKNTPLRLSPYSHKRAEALRWLKRASGPLDGVIAKRMDEAYLPGERGMLKVKRLRTADCVVGGFRYERDGDQVGSLLLGLYDDEGKLNHVGFTSSIPRADRKVLTKQLENLISPPGFTGDAPGGPSRWSTERSAQWEPLKPKLVVEVRYDQVSGRRFRHGTALLRWRPDKSPRQCTYEQLRAPAPSDRLIGRAVGRS
jgi:ATP-dependent DNA ligase